MSAIQQDRRIWWLASYPKSGNTWVRMFLDAYVTGFPVDFNNAFKYVISDMEPTIFQMTTAKALRDLTTFEQFLHYPGVLCNLLHFARTKDVFLKTHNAKCVVEGSPIIPPRITAGAIYLIRDPRDIAISYSKHLGTSINNTIKTMAENGNSGVQADTNLKHIMLTWSDHVRSWTTKNVDVETTLIKYEDLVEDPRKEFWKILESFINNPCEKRFEFALEQTTMKNLQKLEKDQGFPEASNVSPDPFFRVGKANQWKTILTKQQKELIEKQHGEMMEHFGYLKSMALA